MSVSPVVEVTIQWFNGSDSISLHCHWTVSLFSFFLWAFVIETHEIRMHYYKIVEFFLDAKSGSLSAKHNALILEDHSLILAEDSFSVPFPGLILSIFRCRQVLNSLDSPLLLPTGVTRPHSMRSSRQSLSRLRHRLWFSRFSEGCLFWDVYTPHTGGFSNILWSPIILVISPLRSFVFFPAYITRSH